MLVDQFKIMIEVFKIMIEVLWRFQVKFKSQPLKSKQLSIIMKITFEIKKTFVELTSFLKFDISHAMLWNDFLLASFISHFKKINVHTTFYIECDFDDDWWVFSTFRFHPLEYNRTIILRGKCKRPSDLLTNSLALIICIQNWLVYNFFSSSHTKVNAKISVIATVTSVTNLNQRLYCSRGNQAFGKFFKISELTKVKSLSCSLSKKHFRI